jgi:hypothetical protein
MKQIRSVLKFLVVTVFAAFAAGCASQMETTENLAVAAGFKAITPGNPQQQAILASLPAGKVHQVNYQGKTYYVLPDRSHNQAYVGGPKQFQTYQQLRLARQISNQNLMAAQMNEMAAMDWNTWGGWGGWGPAFW